MDTKASRSFRIRIDAAPLLVRSAGVKTYLYHWLTALRLSAPRLVHLYLASINGPISHQGGHRLNLLPLVALSVLNRSGGLFADFAAPDCDIFHISNLLRYPPRKPKLSATLHDLTSWIVPELQLDANVRMDAQFAQRILARADGLIAVSENTRQDAIRILGIRPENIRTIHSGVPQEYFAATPYPNPGKPYFLSVGTIEPRKNIDSLLSAWQSLPSDFRHEHRLVIVGMKGWHSDTTMRRIEQIAHDDPSVEHRGYVPEPEMPALTAGAMALVYVSLYEGFGLPVVQALAAGCPVITSNNSSLPEVGGDAPLYVDPRSVGEIASAIQRIADSPELRASMAARGRERARYFTWERAARESLDYFAALANSSSVASAE